MKARWPRYASYYYAAYYSSHIDGGRSTPVSDEKVPVDQIICHLPEFGVSSASTHYFPAAVALRFPALSFAEMYANDVEGNDHHQVQPARFLPLGVMETLQHQRCDASTSA